MPPYVCNDDNDPHITCCQEIEQQLIVVGDSVKINDKVFSPEEVEMLKTEHEFNNESTFAILQRLTQKTLNCEYEMTYIEWDAPNIWVGQSINKTPAGVGVYTTQTDIQIWTVEQVDGTVQRNGF